MNVRQIWTTALGELQQQTSKSTYDTWLKGTTLLSLEDGAGVVGVSSASAREWLETRFADRLCNVLGHLTGRNVSVRFQIQPRGRGKTAGATLPLPIAEDEPANTNGHAPEREPLGGAVASSTPPPAPAVQQSLPVPDESGLNPRYTFSEFIVGKTNEFASAACHAVADHPGVTYNPLFLYGGVGLGKTHLVTAIGHEARRKGLQVIYVSSETFTNEMIKAIRYNTNEAFRARYRQVDVLIIDDIQFIAGKDSTVEEFFHTFNTLHQANKQIVICADRRPSDMINLADRVRSRFEGGLTANIEPPDIELRIAILRRKADEARVDMPDAVIDFVAQRVQTNIRELEGALNRIIAQGKLRHQPLTLDVARAAMEPLIGGAMRRTITAANVIEAVSNYYHVTLEDLYSKSREKAIVLPRQVAMYLIREEADVSLMQVGQELGGRDHTTVLHGVEKIQAAINDNQQLRRDITAIRAMLFEA